MIKKRIIAYIIDLVIIDIVIFVIGLFCWSYILNNEPNNLQTFSIVITLLPIFLYFFITELIFLKTVGKKIMKIQVAFTGNRFLSILLRTICRFIPLDLVSFLIDEKFLWHDKLSGTQVIDCANLDKQQKEENKIRI